MMQKHIIFIIFTLLFSFSASAQLEVTFTTNSTPTPGGTVDVDVSVSNFDDIVTLQYFILWDSLVLSYDSIFNVTDQLEQFSIGSVGTPETAVTLDDGEMSVSWSHSSTNPFSIPDNTTLFTVRMNVVGTDCDSTAISIGNIPPFQNIEVINADFDDIGAVSNMLPFAIPGTDCGSGGGGGGGGQDGIVLSSTSVSGDSGDNVCVSVVVDNFMDVQTAQASMMWDPAVLSYTGTQNPVLPGTVFGETATDQGMLAFNWFDNSGVTPQNLPDGSVLFDVCFNIIGAPGTSSTFKFTDDPSIIVFSDSNDEEIDFSTGSSTVSVNDDGGGGGGGGGGGDGDLVITMEDGSGNAGSNVCVPMTADNFTNIQTFQGGIMWDPAVLTYTGLNNSSLPGIGVGDSQAALGMLGFNWFDDSGVTPVTLPNGGTIFEVCFDLTGNSGDVSTLKIIDLTNVFIEASDADGNIIDVTTESGTFTIGGDVPFALTCTAPSILNGENGCIDVRTQGFSDIGGVQFQLAWDDSNLTYDRVENLNTAVSVQQGQFNQTQNDRIRFSWISSNGQGQSLPDGSLLFSICFDARSCVGNNINGTMEFVGDNQVPIEVGDGDGDPVLDVSLPSCGYTIICGDEPDCPIIFGTASISPPACFSENTGSITVNPTSSCGMEVTCTWFDGAPGGSVIPTTGCNLTGVGPGVYILRVEVPGVVVEEMSYTIDNVDPLSITGTIFPETCNSLGGVNTVITGGSGTYNCEWEHNGAIGCNIGGLLSGTYTLLVTDAILGCSQVESFPVGIDHDLNGSSTTINADCDGGSITISVDQAGPWNYEWSHPEGTNSPTQTGLDPGNYTCTVTSPNGNCSVVVPATVGNAVEGPFVEQLITTNTSCNENDGTADFIITGGCVPYECEVMAPDGTILSCDSLNNLVPGVYGIMISDASTNPSFVEGFTISVLDEINVEIVTTAETNVSPGTILTTTTGGMPGYSYNWAPETAPGLVQGAPNQTNLEAGEYGLTVTDMAGCTWAISEAIVVIDETDPEAPMVSNEISEDTSCGNECDGEWNADVTGQGPFNYAFANEDGQVIEFSSLPATGLCQGQYDLVITDINGLSTPLTVNIGGEDPIVITLLDSGCDDGTDSGFLFISATGGAGDLDPTWSPIENNTFNPENLAAGTYEVQIADLIGCSVSNIFTVEDCEDPGPVDRACGESSTVLTPNGDGVNDDLFVMCASEYPNTFAIYDRFGRLVHDAVNYQGGWDGTDLNGEIVTEGVYYWVMDSTFDNGDHRIFKGFVNVIRETR